MTKVLLVELSDEEHKKLKTYATAKGSNLTKVIKEFIRNIDIKIELKE